MSSSTQSNSNPCASSSELGNKIHEIIISSPVYQATLVETDDRDRAILRVIDSMINGHPADDVPYEHANLIGAVSSSASSSSVQATTAVSIDFADPSTLLSTPSSPRPSITLPMTITLPLDVNMPDIVGTIYIGSDGNAKMRDGPAILEAFETEKWTRSRKMECQTTRHIVSGIPVVSLNCTLNQRCSRTCTTQRDSVDNPTPISESECVPNGSIIYIKKESATEFDHKRLRPLPARGKGKVKPTNISSDDPKDRKHVKREISAERKHHNPSFAKGKGKGKATRTFPDDSEDMKPIKREFTPDSDSESGPDNDSPSNSPKKHCSSGSKVSRGHTLTRQYTMNPYASSVPRSKPLVKQNSDIFSPEEMRPTYTPYPRTLRREMAFIWSESDFRTGNQSNPSAIDSTITLPAEEIQGHRSGRELQRGMTSIWRAPELDRDTRFASPVRDSTVSPSSEGTGFSRPGVRRPFRRNIPIWRAPGLDLESPSKSTTTTLEASTSAAPQGSTRVRSVRFAERLEEIPFGSRLHASPTRVYPSNVRPLRSAIKTPISMAQPSPGVDTRVPSESSRSACPPSPSEVPVSFKRKRDDSIEEEPEEHLAKKTCSTSSEEPRSYSGSIWDAVDRLFSYIRGPEPASPSHSTVSDDIVIEDTTVSSEATDEHSSPSASTAIVSSPARRAITVSVLPDNIDEWRLDVVPDGPP